MGNIAVIYKSKYGSTKQYAQWIAEDTGADLFDVDKCKADDLASYETVVFGGCIHAGGIQGIDFLKKNFKVLHSKNIIAFAVGLNVDDEAVRQECIEINFEKNLAGIPCYFFRGAYDPSRISGIDKFIMGMVKKMIGGKSPCAMTESEKELLDAVEHGADYVDRKCIKDLVDAIHV